MITSSLLHMSPGAPRGSNNILQVSRDSCLRTIQEIVLALKKGFFAINNIKYYIIIVR